MGGRTVRLVYANTEGLPMVTALTDTERATLDAERCTDDYRDFLNGILAHSTTRTAKAVAELNNARDDAMVDAAIAVRAKYGKTATANALGISRPTLDDWLAKVADDPHLTERVAQHELFVARRLHRK